MMNKKLLITGGVLRPNGFELGEGKYYGCARLLRLDTATHAIETLISVDAGNENTPAQHPNLEFTVGAVERDRLWLSMDTEIRRYAYPSLHLEKTYSHPAFHNIHSVAVRGDRLYVTSTGLDMVAVLNKDDGSIIEYINAEGKPTWHRFSADTDYRKVYSTRPHDCHPNYVFWIDGEPWVTRCTQEDAVNLRDVAQRIDVSGKRRSISVHDGVTHDGKIYFTTVDGAVVIADAARRTVEDVVDLSELPGFVGLRGWCRGLYLDGAIAYVGFTRLRQTKRQEKLAWIRHLLDRGRPVEECSVLAVDLGSRKIVADYRIPLGLLDAIYTVLPEPCAVSGEGGS